MCFESDVGSIASRILARVGFPVCGRDEPERDEVGWLHVEITAWELSPVKIPAAGAARE
jgi:hypothetical protein